MPLIIALHRRHNRRLAWAATTCTAAVALAAPVRIVHLHNAAKGKVAIALDHRLHHLLLQQPRDTPNCRRIAKAEMPFLC